MNGKNIFIEFDIVKNSNPDNLYKEFDVLIAAGKRIFVWSKTIEPQIQRLHCYKIIITLPEKEISIHKKAYDMRYDGKTYQEISDETKIPLNQLSWYMSSPPDKQWTLDDWIADYYKKDSSVYAKVDAVIDNNLRMVDRFKSKGIEGNFLESI